MLSFVVEFFLVLDSPMAKQLLENWPSTIKERWTFGMTWAGWKGEKSVPLADSWSLIPARLSEVTDVEFKTFVWPFKAPLRTPPPHVSVWLSH